MSGAGVPRGLGDIVLTFLSKAFGLNVTADLTLRSGRFNLKISRGRRPLSRRQIAAVSPGLEASLRQSTLYKDVIEVSPLQVPQVISELKALSGSRCEVRIDPGLLELRVGGPPANARFCWEWDSTSRGLRQTGDSAQVLTSGCALSGQIIYELSGIGESDTKWLSAQSIPFQDTISFVRDVLPLMQQRGLRIVCNLAMDPSPAAKFIVSDVTDVKLTLDCEWEIDVERVEASWPKYAVLLHNNKIRPGPDPYLLPERMRRNCEMALLAEEIPIFLEQQLPVLEPFITGDVRTLTQRHSVLHEPWVLALQLVNSMKNGVGAAELRPVLRSMDRTLDAAWLAGQIRQGKKYTRLDDAWLPLSIACTAGIQANGTTTSGVPLRPIMLGTLELLSAFPFHHGLHGLPVEIDPAYVIPTRSVPRSRVDFLQSLISWGIPGGLADELGRIEAELLEFLKQFVESQPEARVLVVGRTKTLSSLPKSWASAAVVKQYASFKTDAGVDKEAGIWLVANNNLSNLGTRKGLNFDLMILLELDNLVGSTASQTYANLAAVSCELVLATFADRGFLQNFYALEAIVRLMKLLPPRASYTKIAGDWLSRLLFSADQTTRPLDHQPPHHEKPGAHLGPPNAEMHVPASFTLDGKSSGYGVEPIPVRSPSVASPVAPQGSGDSLVPRLGQRFEVSRVPVRVNVVTGTRGSFVADAKRFVARSETQARFLPFMSYWPTYASMDPQQLKWYFYWRDQVRKGSPLETDLSYIFLHAYELINMVGVENALDGYSQLHALWLNYRGEHEKLDSYLPDWLADYAAVYPCGKSPMDAYLNALQVGARVWQDDLLFTELRSAGLSAIPLGLLQKLSDYRIAESKFYKGGFKETAVAGLTCVLAAVDEHYTAKHGTGLLEYFRPRKGQELTREPFRSALFEGPRKTLHLGRVYPYLQHAPLRQCVTAIFKHTENCLRETKDFRGRLRGYELPPELLSLIEGRVALLDGEARKSAAASFQIVLDRTKLSRLQAESDEVRDLLLLSQDSAIDSPASDSEERKIQKELYTDVEEVRRVLRAIPSKELEFIKRLMNSECAVRDDENSNEEELYSATINRAARRELGNDLILLEGTSWTVEEDYRDELQWLAQRGVIDEIGREQKDSSQVPGGLPPDWVEIGHRLSPFHLRVLGVLSSPTGDQEVDIRSIAREARSMPSILVDEINELAQEYLGDVLIIEGDSTQVIQEYYLEQVHNFLQVMANGNIQTEALG